MAQTTLDNGLEVVTEVVPGAASVTAGFWVGTGGRDEVQEELGASHFLEHLLFKGTADRSARQISTAMDAVGGDMNAFTAREYTAFYVHLLGEDAQLGIDVLCDIIWSPALRPEEFEAERKVILEEILMHGDEPADVAHELASSALFPGHPLGRDVLGTPTSIAAMNPRSIRDFFERHYLPKNMVFAAAGAVDHDSIVETLASRLGQRAPGGSPKREAPQSFTTPFLASRRHTEQAHLLVAMRGLDRHDPRRWAMDILDHVLGGGISSRLFQEVRENRGLAYSVYSDRVAYDDAGGLIVYAGTSPERATEVLNVVGKELDKLGETGCTPEELEVSKGHMRASMLLAMEDTAARMSRIGKSQLLHGEVLNVQDVLDRIAEVTLDDVAQLAGETLLGQRSVIAVGPFEERSFSASGKLDLVHDLAPYDGFGEA